MFYFADGEDVSLHQLKILDNHPFGYNPPYVSFMNTIIFPHCKKEYERRPAPAPCYHARGQLESWRGSEDRTDARDTASVMVMDIFIGDIVTAPLADHTHAVEV